MSPQDEIALSTYDFVVRWFAAVGVFAVTVHDDIISPVTLKPVVVSLAFSTLLIANLVYTSLTISIHQLESQSNKPKLVPFQEPYTDQ